MHDDLYFVSGSRWTEDNKKKKRWKAALLCLFLGFLGAHKFYEGNTKMGLIYLFTLGIFFVGILVDFVSILSGPKEYYVEVPKKKKKHL